MKRTLLAVLLISVSTANLNAENLKVQLFHTNDIHGWYMSRPASFYKEDPKRLIGGFPVMANALKKLSEPGAATFLVDAGDWFQGTPEGSLSKGSNTVALFNAMKYDLVTLGNHDFDFGEDELKWLIGELKMPVVVSNLYTTADGKRVPYVKPFLIKEVSGVKVGFFGLLTRTMPKLVFPKNFQGLSAGDEVEWGRKTVAELKAAGADVIVLLSHAGLSSNQVKFPIDDRAIAAQVPGIDLIVGGHSHTALREPLRDAANGTMIVQAGTGLSRLGEAVLEIDPETKKVVSSQARLHDLWVDQYGEDPAALALVRKMQAEAGAALDVVIGTAAAFMGRNAAGESTLGSWMTDCARRYTKTQTAFMNSGGLRADLVAGPITSRDIFNIMPFDNALVTLYVSGEQLRQILEHSVSGEHGLLQVSGLSFSFDPAAPKGRRVREVSVSGLPLQGSATYTVTAPDFVVSGGDGYSALEGGADKAFMPILVRDALDWCVRGYSPVMPPEPGRIRKL